MAEKEKSESVSIERISTAPVEVPDEASLREAQKEMQQLQHQTFKSELGWLGRPFGGRNEKPGNISALVIVFCFVAMACVYFLPHEMEHGITIRDAWQTLMSVVTLILGYLFGSNDRPGRD